MERRPTWVASVALAATILVTWVAPAVAAAPQLTMDTPLDGSSSADTTPLFSGTTDCTIGACSDITVTVRDSGGVVVQTSSAPRSSGWSVTATPLSDGTYTATASQSRNGKNGGTTTTPAIGFVVDTTPTPGPIPEPTVDPTPQPTPEPTVDPTPQPTPEPTLDPTPEPTVDPSPEPTVDPAPEPTPDSTPEPTPDSTPAPTPAPTAPSSSSADTPTSGGAVPPVPVPSPLPAPQPTGEGPDGGTPIDPVDAEQSVAGHVTVDTRFISPNGDGRRDVVHVVADFEAHVTWAFELFDQGGPLYSMKGAGESFEHLWDGTVGGEQVPEGVYRWRVFAWSRAAGYSVFDGSIVVDRTVPQIVDLDVSHAPGRARVRIEVAEDSDVLVSIRRHGRLIGRSVTEISGGESSTVVWDHRDGAGRRVPVGRYVVRVIAMDRADNRAVAVLRNIRL